VIAALRQCPTKNIRGADGGAFSRGGGGVSPERKRGQHAKNGTIKDHLDEKKLSFLGKRRNSPNFVPGGKKRGVVTCLRVWERGHYAREVHDGEKKLLKGKKQKVGFVKKKKEKNQGGLFSLGGGGPLHWGPGKGKGVAVWGIDPRASGWGGQGIQEYKSTSCLEGTPVASKKSLKGG